MRCFMGSTLAALVMTCTLSYCPEETPSYDPFSLQSSEKEEDSTYIQKFAKNLYEKMQKRDNIVALFFESYGEKHKGFYVEKNHPQESGKYLTFHADDQAGGKTAVIRLSREFKSIDSVVLKKFKDGELVKQLEVSPEDNNAMQLYLRMAKTSINYIDRTEVIKQPYGNSAKYNYFLKDEHFVTALENLLGKLDFDNS